MGAPGQLVCPPCATAPRAPAALLCGPRSSSSSSSRRSGSRTAPRAWAARPRPARRSSPRKGPVVSPLAAVQVDTLPPSPASDVASTSEHVPAEAAGLQQQQQQHGRAPPAQPAPHSTTGASSSSSSSSSEGKVGTTTTTTSSSSSSPLSCDAWDTRRAGPAGGAAAATTRAGSRPSEGAASPSSSSSSPSSSSPSPSSSSSSSASPAPSLADRAVAACVFLLPLAEGLYRLALLATHTCRHNALDLAVWAQVHAATLSDTLAAAGRGAAAAKAAEELQACNVMALWSSTIYARLTDVLRQLTSLTSAPPLDAALPLPLPHHPASSSLPFSPEVGRWLAAAFGTPVALWSLAGLGALALVMQHAQQLLDARDARHRRRHSSGGGGGSAASPASSLSSSEELEAEGLPLLRRPDMVLLACSCAVLLRVAWVPLTSLSGLALSVYSPLAVMLTLAATYVATAAFCRMWWVRLPGSSLRDGMGEMAEGVLGVVLWHRTLVLLDWLLSAFSSSAFAFKVQLAGCFLVYSLSVDHLSKVVAHGLDAKRGHPKHGSNGGSRRGGGGGGGGGGALWVGAPSQPNTGAAGL